MTAGQYSLLAASIFAFAALQQFVRAVAGVPIKCRPHDDLVSSRAQTGMAYAACPAIKNMQHRRVHTSTRSTKQVGKAQ